MSDKRLEKARKYELENTQDIPKEQRPVFHMSVPIGWMNDPNGFSLYKGEKHLFYQYYPYDTCWGPMHWGHAKTKDFIKWEYLPAALAPDKEYDEFGVFSGSAIEERGKQILMYTGVKEIKCTDGKTEVRQTQCIAVGDGVNYDKLEENPVITADMLPEGSSLVDFRDPKIWKEADVFYAAVGSRNEDGSGQIALFSSVDLKKWEFCSILDKCNNRYGKMWECPDFFNLGGKHILMVSPQDMTAEGLEFHNGNGVMFACGDYDLEEKTLKREMVQSVDYGLDFYAPQTMLTEDGRRIMIAWMKSWETSLWPEEFRWNSMMTIPRELQYKNGRVIQNPVRELESYYENKIEYSLVNCRERAKLAKVEGRNIDLTVDIASGDYEKFQIDFACNERYHTSLIYNKKDNTITFDRQYAGCAKDIVHSRSMYVKENDGKIKIRLLLDKYSAEIFVNDGEQAMTSLLYTEPGAKEIYFQADKTACISVTKYDIKKTV